ncbi:MAG: heterocyst frequency control protein PatD [cyanobacterium endosymbiont of Rhopalodia sterrenbergii]
MLPKPHQKFYQKFLASLITLRAQVMIKDIDSGRLSQNFRVAQEIFQNQILELTTENLEASVVSSWQSIQTEVHRTLRLLKTNFLFLQSSHKRGTEEQRLEIVLDHIEKLIGYCQVILSQ